MAWKSTDVAFFGILVIVLGLAALRYEFAVGPVILSGKGSIPTVFPPLGIEPSLGTGSKICIGVLGSFNTHC